MISALGNVNVAFSAGAMVGCLLVGKMADSIGRYNTNMLCMILAFGSYAVMGIQEYPLLLIGRFISGVSGGISSSLSGAYAQETVPETYRNLAKVSLFGFMTMTGLSGFVFCAILDKKISEYWRIELLLIPFTLTCIRFFLFLLCFQIESPRYIIQKFSNKINDKNIDLLQSSTLKRELVVCLSKLYSKEFIPKKIEYEINLYETTIKEAEPGYLAMTRVPYRSRLITGIILSFAQQASGVALLNSYGSVFFSTVSSFNSNWLTTFTGSFNFLGSIVALVFSSKLEKKNNMIISLVGQIISFYLLNLFFYLGYSDLAVVCALTFMLNFGFGLGATMYAYIPEILPSTGVGITMFFKWTFISISVKIIPIMTSKLGVYWSINIFIILMLISLFLMLLMLVRTKGKNQKGIELRYQQREKLGIIQRFVNW